MEPGRGRRGLGDRPLGLRAGAEPVAPFRVREDARLTQELGYCVPLGLPHSAFLSWSVDDQDKALAYVADQAAKCSRCRTRPDEWDPKLGGDRHAYYAEPSRCGGCEALDVAARDLKASAGDDALHGVRLGLVRNTGEDDEDDDGPASLETVSPGPVIGPPSLGDAEVPDVVPAPDPEVSRA